ncbi:unnamed protein product [Oppiella nova]|uniref:Laminin N-terminal domain-containing protein n=1 Tax=Oppiella nova TaxID=334625 RepID=A0A7R9QJ24_9ACAR|nr:unnamed protein product [Oppiella nova]CAG2166348.1 unnamed protein product [Oppiella nova]
MRHSRIAKSRRHKKFKCVDNTCHDNDHNDHGHIGTDNKFKDQSIPRKWQQILDLKQQMKHKTNTKKNKRKKINNELICVRTTSEPIEKGMTRSAKQLPEVIEQGLYESEIHFMSRLTKLSAKAKAEANIEDRFDVDFCQKLDTNEDKVEEKSDDKKKTKSNKRLKRKLIENKRREKKRVKSKSKSKSKSKKEDLFEHLTDRVMFGERVAEPPLLDSFPFKRNPRRCIPDFVNAAFTKEVKVSSECGNPPTRLCVASNDERGDIIRDCQVCDQSNPKRRHPASYLTDLNNPNNLSCWISEPFTQVNQNVTLTLSLSKKYELTYISLQFCAAKPDSMAIFKSMDYGESWHPFQYYSSQCRKVYGRQNRAAITKANEQEPLCADSNTEPIPGARVAFSTLEGRPSAYDFDNSPVLQDWVTATDIKIVFNRINIRTSALEETTIGAIDENITDTSNDLTKPSDGVYYAVSDLAVGGRCKCNGHASK